MSSVVLGLESIASFSTKLQADSAADVSVDPAFAGPNLDLNNPQMCTVERSLFVCRNLVYSQVDGDTLQLDIYLPPSAGKQRVPGIFYFHGGGWHSGSKEEAQPIAPGDTTISASPFSPAVVSSSLGDISSTYAIISVNYRLTVAMPSQGIINPAGFPQSLQDVKTAIQWVRAKASAYIDGDRLIAWGFSAGGYFATMVGTTEGIPQFAGRGPSNIGSDVLGVVAVSPVVDLSVLKLAAYQDYLETVDSITCSSALAEAKTNLADSADFSPPVGTALFLGLTSLPLTADSAATSDSNSQIFDEAAPINYLSDTTVPMLIFNAGCDTVVPLTGMDNFMLKAGKVHKISDTIDIAGPADETQLITRAMTLGQTHGGALYYKDDTAQGTIDSALLVRRFLDSIDH